MSRILRTNSASYPNVPNVGMLSRVFGFFESMIEGNDLYKIESGLPCRDKMKFNARLETVVFFEKCRGLCSPALGCPQTSQTSYPEAMTKKDAQG